MSQTMVGWPLGVGYPKTKAQAQVPWISGFYPVALARVQPGQINRDPREKETMNIQPGSLGSRNQIAHVYVLMRNALISF